MKDPLRKTPFRAWLASLPLALALPVVGWIIVLVIFYRSQVAKLTVSDFGPVLAVAGITVLIHLFGYLLTGLPLFLLQYKNPRSRLWKPILGTLLATFAGALTVFTLFGGWDQTKMDVEVFYLGAGYGIATAIAALRQRPTLA